MATPSAATLKPRLRGVFISGRSSCRWWRRGARAGRARRPGDRRHRDLRVKVAALFGISALYHRITWAPVSARRWMRRLDHTMIFFLIAGTYTPFALLVLDGTLATAILCGVWGGVLAGVILNLVWIDSPKWVTALVYVALGWVAVIALPEPTSGARGRSRSAITLAGLWRLLYTAGAVICAKRRPDQVPAVFSSGSAITATQPSAT